MANNFTHTPLQEIAIGDLVRGETTVSFVREIRESRIRPGSFIIILKNGHMIRVAPNETVAKAF